MVQQELATGWIGTEPGGLCLRTVFPCEAVTEA